MKALISYVLLILNEPMNDTANLRLFAENYFENSTSVEIWTSQPTAWHEIFDEVTVTIQNWSSTSPGSSAQAGIILDLRMENWTEHQLPPSYRHDTKVAIIVDAYQKEEVMRRVHQMGICRVVIVAPGEEMTEVVNACRRMGTTRLPKATDNCRGNVSFMDLPPNNFFRNNQLSGFEGKMLQLAADYLKIKLDFINQHETGYGQFEPPSGVLGDMITGTSFAACGTLYPFHYRWLRTEMIFGCHTMSIAWAAPVGAGPTEPTWFIILVSELSVTVWTLVLTICIGLVPMSIIFDDRSWNTASRPFQILALMLGISQRFPFHKKFIIIVIFFGFMVSAYYQAMMSTKLTVPKKVPEITNLVELVQSGLKLSGPPSHGKVMADVALASPEDQTKQAIARNYVVSHATTEDVLLNMTKQRDQAYLRNTFNLYYLSEQNVETAGKIHIVEEAVATFIPVVMTPKNSCLAPKLQEIYLRLCHSGLGRKLQDDFTARRKPLAAKGPMRLSLEHTRGFLYLLLVGWAVSAVAFASEIGYDAGMKRYCTTPVRQINADHFIKRMYKLW